MEHEVFVPVTPETVRKALRDPARVARCVPGLQQDADESAGPLSGRLKVRIGGHTITYRGTLRIVEQGEVFAVEGEGVEARGTGSAKVTLTIRPQPTEGGTALTFTAASRAEGRLAELDPAQTTAAAHRLLDRFADRLGDAAGATPAAASVPQPASDAHDASPSATADATAPDADATAPDADATAADDATPADADVDDEANASVFDAPVPPPSLDPVAEEPFGAVDGPDAAEAEELHEIPVIPDEPPAEAAHARRTMIGRSAEEVDHAPPRGRYAPTPPPDAGSAGATLRWVAPAAALAIASAVVVGRVLRRRK
ncbi:SRPBCC domain-containing protein [Streptomyces sp. V1I1]|uniref:SRPBCC domain-containing protein n=1 Tax=Streptomyces sp. V1I1 TaxID=3042272 RepID=UPI0027826139|nr:SRPBCC domain-containing protein [Streptomyces sp. V1I1]MDQ0941884.1 carbon monoxide dehydrogenase subunit G [Streptomyces sp. V1I1]